MVIIKPTDENIEDFSTEGVEGTVPVSQGDGTLEMADVETSGTADTGEVVAFETGLTGYSDQLSQQEIHRIVLVDSEELVLKRIEFHEEGGGEEDSNNFIEIVDEDQDTVIETADLNQVVKTDSTSSEASSISIKITTDEDLDATLRVIGEIL